MAYSTDSLEVKKKAAEYMRLYYRSHPNYRAGVIARSRARELANPEEKRKNGTLYRERHRNALNKKAAAIQRINRQDPKLLAKDRTYLEEWRLRNRARIKETRQAWRQRNRVKLALQERARQAQSSTPISEKEISNWESRICGICNKLIEDKFHVDHKIPLSKGGLHVISNLQLAHPTCNLKKKDKLYFTM